MIFPILDGLRGWSRAPVTWLIILLNVGVFVYTSTSGLLPQQKLDQFMKNDFFIQTQGKIYAQYLENHAPAGDSSFLKQLAQEVRGGDFDRADLLGQLAFRDTDFVAHANSINYPRDIVALKMWRENLNQVQLLEDQHPSFTLGLNANDAGLERWVSYIFVHSGWLHLFGNMLFLAIFGTALEIQIGGLGLLVVFLLSGILGAGVFALMTGVTSSPLVGASGAISGVMALFCVLNWSAPQRFFYWLFLPFRGFMGFVFLPAWVVAALWFSTDIAGFVGTIPELGGVAHTAHLGGEFAGVLTGLILFAIRKYRPLQSQPQREPRPPVGKLIPFLPPANGTRRRISA